MVASTYTSMNSSMNFQIIKQQDLSRMIDKLAKNVPNASHTEPYKGKALGSPATLDTYEKLNLHFARMGVGGDGAYAAVLLLISRNPELAIYLPEDSVARESKQTLPLAELSRDQSGFVQQTMPQTDFNNNKPQERNYKNNPYSYARYVKVGYFKSAAKAAYSRIEKEIRDAVTKIKGVYQSSRGFLRSGKNYRGQDNVPSGNVILLDSYRRAKPTDSVDLEGRIAT